MDKLSILKKIFPNPNASFAGRDGQEVNGLAKGTVPENCEILSSGMSSSHLPGRQEHYLVRVDDALAYLRICDAMPDSGYAEYAVVYGIAFTEEDKLNLTERAARFIESCCRPRP